MLAYNIQLLESIETTYKLSHVVQMRLFTQVAQLSGQFSQSLKSSFRMALLEQVRHFRFVPSK